MIIVAEERVPTVIDLIARNSSNSSDHLSNPHSEKPVLKAAKHSAQEPLILEDL